MFNRHSTNPDSTRTNWPSVIKKSYDVIGNHGAMVTGERFYMYNNTYGIKSKPRTATTGQCVADDET